MSKTGYGLSQKQKTIVFIVLSIFFLSIVMTEKQLWSMTNLLDIRTVTKIIVLVLQLPAIFICLRLYRAFKNHFFKFQGIALTMGVFNTGLYGLQALIFKQIPYNNEAALYQIFSTSMNSISAIIRLAGILLALYAILRYRESWEQAEKAPLVQRFNDLVPSARDNRLFWPVIIGAPLLLDLLLVLASSSAPIGVIPLFSFSFYTAGLAAQLLALLLCLALVRAYGNRFFKYMASFYIISMSVTLFSCLYSISGFFMYRFWDSSLPALYMFANRTFNYIVVFHEVALGALLLIALLTYRESATDSL